METTSPENVSEEIQSLLRGYNADSDKTLEDLLDFHYKFERIHPFQDGNHKIEKLAKRIVKNIIDNIGKVGSKS